MPIPCIGRGWHPPKRVKGYCTRTNNKYSLPDTFNSNIFHCFFFVHDDYNHFSYLLRWYAVISYVVTSSGIYQRTCLGCSCCFSLNKCCITGLWPLRHWHFLFLLWLPLVKLRQGIREHCRFDTCPGKLCSFTDFYFCHGQYQQGNSHGGRRCPWK